MKLDNLNVCANFAIIQCSTEFLPTFHVICHCLRSVIVDVTGTEQECFSSCLRNPNIFHCQTYRIQQRWNSSVNMTMTTENIHFVSVLEEV